MAEWIIGGVILVGLLIFIGVRIWARLFNRYG